MYPTPGFTLHVPAAAAKSHCTTSKVGTYSRQLPGLVRPLLSELFARYGKHGWHDRHGGGWEDGRAEGDSWRDGGGGGDGDAGQRRGKDNEGEEGGFGHDRRG